MNLTQKQENFTLNLFKGMCQRAAYIDAYHPTYALSTIDANASILANKQKVQTRWAELREEAKSVAIADAEERKQVLTEIIRGRMTDFVTVGADGAYFDVGAEKLNTKAIMSAGSKTEIDKDGNGQTVFTRVFLHNPIKAIAELNKMDGAYAPEKHEHTGKDGGAIEIDHRAVLVSRINYLVEQRGTPEIPEQTQQ